MPEVYHYPKSLSTNYLALKDFSDALVLADSFDMEKEIRLRRLELFSISPLSEKAWDEDFSWAKKNTQDEEYGMVLFFAARKMNSYSIYTSKGWDSNAVIELIDLAIKLGYEDPKAYYLRASAHFSNQNYGLALHDINIAVNMIQGEAKILIGCLDLRTGILMRMGRFEAAYAELVEITKIEPSYKNEWLIGDEHSLTKEIYQRIGLQWKFGYIPKDIGVYKFIITLLILNDGLPQYVQIKENEKPREFTRGITIDKELPFIASVLEEIIGGENWQAAKLGQAYNASISLKRSRAE